MLKKFLKSKNLSFGKILKVSLIFLFGFLFANLLNFYLAYGLESPLPTFGLSNLLFLSSKNAPFDFVKESQIEVYPDKIIINVENASISRYSATGSMKPILDENSNGIRVEAKSEEDIHIGDIVTFVQNDHFIVHRVVDKGTDENGVFYITKGDNNSIDDGKIRFRDIKYITIGIIW